MTTHDNNFVTITHHSELAQKVSAMTLDQLRGELQRTLAATAEQLLYLSLLYRELKSRGVDLSKLEQGIAKYFAAIADRRLLPDIVIQYASRPIIIQAVESLPLEEQEGFAKNTNIKIVTQIEGQSESVETKPLMDLTASQIRQVFDRGRIRTVAEQKRYLRAMNNSDRQPREPGVTFDYKTQTFAVGATRVSLSSILLALEAKDMITEAESERIKSRGK